MQKKMSLINHVYIILIGLTVAAISGYFSNLRKGDVEGFVKGIILVPAIVWIGNVIWSRYKTSRALSWGVERIATMSGPAKIGIKYGILGTAVFFIYMLAISLAGIAGPVLGIGGMVAIIGMTGILASREAFRKGRQMGREEKD